MDERMVPEIIYLIAYIVISDNRLYDSEWSFIDKIIKENEYDESIRSNAIAIIMDKEDKISFDDVVNCINKMSSEVKDKAIETAFEVAYSNGIIVTKEEELLLEVSDRLGITKDNYNNIKNMAQKSIKKRKVKKNRNEILNKRYGKRLFSRDRYEKLIKEMSVVAREDLKIAKSHTESTLEKLNAFPQLLKDNINSILKNEEKLSDESSKEQLSSSFNNLSEDIKKLINELNEELYILRERQESSSETYTIAFMGRTKAGKSTLHSVLLGGINNEFIGAGGERTTRYNYIYDFEGLRIIDTPGIGAPGGKKDTQIAEEIVDESDLICYVVTSDSIQETEFNFLNKLKNQNKPVVIILNKKENFLRTSKKKQAFLDNPLDWYERDGVDSIQGHIDRINEYVNLNHEYHNYIIVPVHLLAAKMSFYETDDDIKQKLLKGSRIREFLSVLDDRITMFGKIQRSQTIYDSTIFHFESKVKNIKMHREKIHAFRTEMEKNVYDATRKIEQCGKESKNIFEQKYEAIYADFISTKLRKFADENCTCKEMELKINWEQFLKKYDIDKQVQNSISYVWNDYQSNVEEIIKEVEENMSFSMEFGNIGKIHLHSGFDFKFATNITSSIFGLAGALTLFFLESNPIGWILTGVGLALGIAGLFVKSKEKKINENRNNLYKSIKSDVLAQKIKNYKAIIKEFDNNQSRILKMISNTYSAMIKTMMELERSLELLENEQTVNINILNKIFGARIVNYMFQEEYYNMSKVLNLSQLSVSRKFKRKINIWDMDLKYKKMKISEDEMTEILQEEVVING